MPSIPSGSTVTNATLNATLYSGTNSWGSLSVYRLTSAWNSYTVTWNNHWSIGQALLSTGVNPIYSSPYYRYNIDVTSTVADWYANSMNNNWGFMLKYDNESYNDYNWLYSSDSTINNAYKPAITVTYNDPILQNDYSLMGWTYPLDGYYNISCGFKVCSYMGVVHNAMDINQVPEGTNIKNSVTGVVKISRWDDSAGYWLVIETNVKDPSTNNNLRVGYMHMRSQPYYSVGQTIPQSAIIGQVGSTGEATGVHLHFEIIRDGVSWATRGRPSSAVNPQKFWPSIPFTGNTSNLMY